MGKKPSSQLIADWVVQYISDSEWRLLKEICYNSIKQFAKDCDDSWAQELVEENLEHIAEELRNKNAEAITDGELLLFQIDDEVDPYIRSLKGELNEKINVLHRIDPAQFEEVCKQILEHLGGKANVLGGANDEGVDFVSDELSFTTNHDLPIPIKCMCSVIGQAKRYKRGKYVTEKEMRDFVGAAMLKIQDFRASEKILQFTPIILAFWTSADFHVDAKRYARRLGIWTMNGWTMIQYIKKFNIDI